MLDEIPIAASDLVELSSGSTVIEAELLASRLRGDGVRVVLRDLQINATHAPLGQAIGGVKVLVHVADLERARLLLRAKRGGEVFIVHRKTYFMSVAIGIVAGAAVGAVIAAGVELPALFFVCIVAGAIIGSRIASGGSTFCASCAAVTELEPKLCPGCGGTVVGVIASADDRLDAEERRAAERKGERHTSES